MSKSGTILRKLFVSLFYKILAINII